MPKMVKILNTSQSNEIHRVDSPSYGHSKYIFFIGGDALILGRGGLKVRVLWPKTAIFHHYDVIMTS